METFLILLNELETTQQIKIQENGKKNYSIEVYDIHT